jgi:hypothetical protein
MLMFGALREFNLLMLCGLSQVCWKSVCRESGLRMLGKTLVVTVPILGKQEWHSSLSADLARNLCGILLDCWEAHGGGHTVFHRVGVSVCWIDIV